MDQTSRRPGGKRESRTRGPLDGLGSGVAGADGVPGWVDGGWSEVEPEVPELGPEVRPEVVGIGVFGCVVASVMSEHDADLSSACNPDPGWAAAAAGRAGLTGGGGTRKPASSATTIFFLGVSVGGEF